MQATRPASLASPSLSAERQARRAAQQCRQRLSCVPRSAASPDCGCSSGGGGNNSSAAAAANGVGNNSSGSGSGCTPAAASSSASGSGRIEVQHAACDAPCSTPKAARPAVQWPPKSELYILRSDGHSCTRETVQRECGIGVWKGPDGLTTRAPRCTRARLAQQARRPACQSTADTVLLRLAPPACLFRGAASGNLQFACPSSQQQLLVWKTRPRRWWGTAGGACRMAPAASAACSAALQRTPSCLAAAARVCSRFASCSRPSLVRGPFCGPASPGDPGAEANRLVP